MLSIASVCVCVTHYTYYFNRILCVHTVHLKMCIRHKRETKLISALRKIMYSIYRWLDCLHIHIFVCVCVDFERFDCDSFYTLIFIDSYTLFAFYLFPLHDYSIFALRFFSFWFVAMIFCCDARNFEIRLCLPSKQVQNDNKIKQKYKSYTDNLIYTRACSSLIWSMPAEKDELEQKCMTAIARQSNLCFNRYKIVVIQF